MGVIKSIQSILRKNSAGSDFQRRRINIIEGTNVTVTFSDDPTNNEVDITIASTGGSVATDAIWDAKGDLAAGTGVDTATKVTVGANNTVLVANSAIANGVNWSATLAGLTLTSPTLTTPVLGTPSSGILTSCTGLPEGGLSLTDITTNNASASAHGFVPKWPNNTTTFFRGDGTYAIPLIRSKQIYATRDMTSATGDVAYTGFGFIPRHFTLVSSISGTIVASWGMCDVSGGTYGTGFVTYLTYLSQFGQSISLGVSVLNTAGGTDQEGKVKSFDADGVTLTWTKNGSPTGTADLQFLAAN